MRFSFCASTQYIPAVIEAGFDCVDLRVQNAFAATIPEDEYRLKRAELDKYDIPRISAVTLIPRTFRLLGNNSDVETVKDYIRITFRRAKELGLENIVFGSAPARDLPDGFDVTAGMYQMVEFSKFLADEGAKNNLTVVLEPLHKKEANTFNTVASGALLVQMVNHPNFKLLTDYYHFTADDNDLTSLALSMPLIRHAHIATSLNRRYPGVEESDYSAWMNVLKTGGYDGVISVEASGDISVEVLAKSVEVLRNAWQNA